MSSGVLREGDPCSHGGRRLRVLRADRMRRRLSVASRMAAYSVARALAGDGSSSTSYIDAQRARLSMYDLRCLRCDNVTRVRTRDDPRKRSRS